MSELEKRLEGHGLRVSEGVNEDCQQAAAQLRRYREALGAEVEKVVLHTNERKLLLHDDEINAVIQRRLEQGTWIMGPNGYLRAPDTLQEQTP